MNQQEATQFINRLFTEVWANSNIKKIPEFYHQDVVGYFGEQQIIFDDIKNRASYGQELFSKVHTEILDIIANDNKIAVRFKQTATKKDNSQVLEQNPLVIYHLRDGKVSKLWFLTDKPFDYKEKV